MLDKIKGFLPEPIKSKLFPSRPAEDGNVDNSYEEEEESHDTSNKKSDDGSQSNRNSMIIRGVIVLVLGYLAVDHFFLNPQEESVDIAASPAKPRRPRKKIEKQEALAPTEEKKEEKNSEAVPNKEEVKIDSPSIDQAKVDVPKTEEPKLDLEKKDEEKVEPVPTSEAKVEIPKKEESPIEEINITKKQDDGEKKVSGTDIATAVGEETKIEKKTNLDSSIDKLIDEADGGDPDSKTVGKTEKKKPKKSLEDAIVEDIYVAPPQYDKLGRGLVYSCKDKHWACVDKIAYVACNKNMKYNKAHGKKAECAVKNVYDSDEDCTTIQKYYVSVNQETSFCDN